MNILHGYIVVIVDCWSDKTRFFDTVMTFSDHLKSQQIKKSPLQ